MVRATLGCFVTVFTPNIAFNRLYGTAVTAAEELPHFSLACVAHEDEAPLSRAQFINELTIYMNYEQSKQFLFT